MASQKFELDGFDWQKVKVGAGVAFGGALITFLPMLIDGVTYQVGGINFTPFVGFLASVIVNIVRKWIADNTPST